VFESLAGSSVVVTGASKGIGRGIASVFAGAGAHVLVVSRDAAAGQAAAAELTERLAGRADAPGRPAAGQVTAFAGDVSDPTSCAEMAAAAVARHGGIDVLCANAGKFPERRLAELTAGDIDDVLGTNLKGTMLSVQACLPALRASGRGRVVITSSITGPVTGFPGWTHYGASKAGQLGFMRTAALELAPDGITVNAVLPGNVLTEGLTDLGADYLDQMSAAIPLKRLGSVEDIGFAALFLASREAGYITGHALVVDGGQVLPESLMALDAMGG